MEYYTYKLHFITPVHFGKNALNNSEYSVCSDTLFSALCTEASKIGSDALDMLVDLARTGRFKISDAFPFIEDKYLLPKPYTFVERKDETDSSVIRKAYKNLKYISSEEFDNYLNGCFDIMSATDIHRLGKSSLKVSASIRNEKNETMPYEIGTFSFSSNCGLYIIIGCDGCTDLIDNLMSQLSYSGIGGKKSSGYGRFSYEKEPTSNWMVNKMSPDSSMLMLINTALPKEDELEIALKDSKYSLIKRSGFVTSPLYSDSWQRKRDIVMFKSGSCFSCCFEGDVYDVSTSAGSHPVYRLGVPLFMRIDI